MSKNLTVRVTKEIYDLIQTRANINGISKYEMATVIFNFGLRTAASEMRRQAEAVSPALTGPETTVTTQAEETK